MTLNRCARQRGEARISKLLLCCHCVPFMMILMKSQHRNTIYFAISLSRLVYFSLSLFPQSFCRQHFAVLQKCRCRSELKCPQTNRIPYEHGEALSFLVPGLISLYYHCGNLVTLLNRPPNVDLTTLRFTRFTTSIQAGPLLSGLARLAGAKWGGRALGFGLQSLRVSDIEKWVTFIFRKKRHQTCFFSLTCRYINDFDWSWTWLSTEGLAACALTLHWGFAHVRM